MKHSSGGQGKTGIKRSTGKEDAGSYRWRGGEGGVQSGSPSRISEKKARRISCVEGVICKAAVKQLRTAPAPNHVLIAYRAHASFLRGVDIDFLGQSSIESPFSFSPYEIRPQGFWFLDDIMSWWKFQIFVRRRKPSTRSICLVHLDELSILYPSSLRYLNLWGASRFTSCSCTSPLSVEHFEGQGAGRVGLSSGFMGKSWHVLIGKCLQAISNVQVAELLKGLPVVRASLRSALKRGAQTESAGIWGVIWSVAGMILKIRKVVPNVLSLITNEHL